MTAHFYAVGDEPWQPLHAPDGQEMTVVRAVALAVPGRRVRLARAEGDEKKAVASYVVRAEGGTREHVVIVYNERKSGAFVAA